MSHIILISGREHKVSDANWDKAQEKFKEELNKDDKSRKIKEWLLLNKYAKPHIRDKVDEQLAKLCKAFGEAYDKAADKTTAVLLFGIANYKEIERYGVAMVMRNTTVTSGMTADLNKGVNLGRLVTINEKKL
jgi:hypothetical protein